jgi:hypothetical protein
MDRPIGVYGPHDGEEVFRPVEISPEPSEFQLNGPGYLFQGCNPAPAGLLHPEVHVVSGEHAFPGAVADHPVEIGYE